MVAHVLIPSLKLLNQNHTNSAWIDNPHATSVQRHRLLHTVRPVSTVFLKVLITIAAALESRPQWSLMNSRAVTRRTLKFFIINCPPNRRPFTELAGWKTGSHRSYQDREGHHGTSPPSRSVKCDSLRHHMLKFRGRAIPALSPLPSRTVNRDNLGHHLLRFRKIDKPVGILVHTANHPFHIVPIG